MADYLWCLRRMAAVLAAALAAGCAGTGTRHAAPEVRETRYGAVRGVDDSARSGTYAWKGIPFARPPVGELRWLPPVEPVAWLGERDATRFGNACLQMGRIYGPGANNRFDDSIAETLGTPVGSEDCLTLNIWRPADGRTHLPVVLFLHGGSAISGYTADPVYDGAALARAAHAVVVTANYRLDVLGFLQLPPLKAGDASYSGNHALLDHVQALRFIQRDIAAFGGDPGNVTLMGQSAGAINALALLTAPQAAGLFHKIIPVSGGLSLAANLPQGTIPTLKPASSYAAQAQKLLASLIVADGLAADPGAAQALAATWTPAQTASYLRGKDARMLLQTVFKNGPASSPRTSLMPRICRWRRPARATTPARPCWASCSSARAATTCSTPCAASRPRCGTTSSTGPSSRRPGTMCMARPMRSICHSCLAISDRRCSHGSPTAGPTSQDGRPCRAP